ncbi:MAG: hypothetical protein NNA18_04130 [Nitrospira sp.]|nr:hypothetical protein [Nitrospira sp.]
MSKMFDDIELTETAWTNYGHLLPHLVRHLAREARISRFTIKRLACSVRIRVD